MGIKMEKQTEYDGRYGYVQVVDPVEFFRKKPSMFIGKKSIYGLQCFIAGTQVAAFNKLFRWGEFEEWFAKNKEWNGGKSFAVVLKECNGDDDKAFDLWFNLYDEFLNAHSTTKN
jgi:hypothetical protein